MKKKDVQIGEVYSAKVSGKSAAVRIDGVNAWGGWNGTNMKTNKPVRIKSARRLRGKAIWPPATSAKAKPPEGVAETVAAVAKGDLAKGVKVPTAKVKKPAPPGLARPKGRRGRPAAKKATRAKPGGKDRKLGGLDAAARVLAEAGRPMKADQIVAVALTKGYWHTAGKTPVATIYAAMIREIAAKGDQARFRRAMVRGKTSDGEPTVQRGYFELSPAGAAAAKRTSSSVKSKK